MSDFFASHAIHDADLIPSQALRDLAAVAHEKLRREIADVAPDLARELHPWMEGLAPKDSPPEAYFLHPLAFPLLQLPWWFDESIGHGVDENLQQDLVASSMCGYYAIRMIDDVMDRSPAARPDLLPAIGIYQDLFQSRYAARFPPDDPFWTTFHRAWAQGHEAAVTDGHLVDIDKVTFERISGRKVGAALIPIAAVARHHGLDAIPATWQRFFDAYCPWHQLHNDLLDWQRDARERRTTWFLSEGRRRCREGESLESWAAREGVELGISWLQDGLRELRELASVIGVDALLRYLAGRTRKLDDFLSEVRPALTAIRALSSIGRPDPGLARPAPLTGLMETAQVALQRVRDDLERHGLKLDPATQVVAGNGLLSWYDCEDRLIHLSLPDVTTPIGVVQAAFFGQMLGCRDNAELDELIRLVIPWLMAHEVGHALRHQAGLFGDDPWLEEQIANQFASALTKRQTMPEDRRRLLALLHRTVDHLRGQIGADVAVDSHGDAHHALGVAGVLRHGTVRSLATIESMFSLTPESVLQEVHGGSDELGDLLERRRATIQSFKDEYASSVLRYAAFQLGWMVIALEGAEQHLVGELAERHLGHTRAKLNALGDSPATEGRVRACSAAYKSLRDEGHPLAPWFYKRYRALLLEMVATSGRTPNGEFDREERRVAEEQDEDEPGTLDLMVSIAPPELRPLFPSRIDERGDLADLSVAERALYDTAKGNSDRAEAVDVVKRLALLLGTSFYSGLPAALLYDLAQEALPLHLRAGEALIWQGAYDDDVYLIVRGRLEIRVAPNDGGNPVAVGMIGSGEVVGEIAFVSGDPRSATLLATEPVECLVLRALSMRLAGYAHPELLLRVGRLIAKRLRTANERGSGA